MYRTFVLLIILFAVSAPAAFGQERGSADRIPAATGSVDRTADSSKVDIFGGYSYQGVAKPWVHLNGWEASATANVNRWFGIETDLSGHYDSERNDDPAGRFSFRNATRRHSVLAGPKFTYHAGRTSLFAHGLFGVVHQSDEAFGAYFGPVDFAYVRSSSTDFGTALGVGVDVNLNHRLSIRPLQVDYTYSPVYGDGGPLRNGVRASAGLVLHLGSR